MKAARRVLPLIPLIPLLSCELTEVTVPRGEPRIIVQSVFSRLASEQFVVVERSITGEGPDAFFGDQIPPEGPVRPIEGAVVVLEYPAGTACGPAGDTLAPRDSAPGVYRTQSPCTPAPGDAVGLRVVTPDGGVVTGTSTIPGGAVVVDVGGGGLRPGFLGLINQDRDTMRLRAEPVVARGMQVEVRRFSGPADPVFFLLTDSLRLTLSAGLVNPFESDDGEMVFRAGFEYHLTIALTDTNYYDFARSFSDPFTGHGFINRLTGGIGVFGSVDSRSYGLRVVADVDDPREGAYRVTGTLDGRTVDVMLELYLDQRPRGRFGAFVEGTWAERVAMTSAAGRFGGANGDPDSLNASFDVEPTPPDSTTQWQIRGRRAARGTSFPLEVVGFGAGLIRGQVTAVQVSGPTVASTQQHED
jgi:hypothetical protein